MTKSVYSIGLILIFSLLLSFSPNAEALAADKDGYKGWQIGSAYNQLYNPKERDKLKGTVSKFKTITPLPGMDPGTALVLEESKDEKILIHLCPKAYAQAKQTGIKRGDKVKVRGSWVELDGEDVFIASKVKRGDHFEFKVRLTSDGTPFWTMSPEQLKKEMKQ